MNLWITVGKEGRYLALTDQVWECGSFKRAVRAVLKILKETPEVKRLVLPSMRELKQWSRVENPDHEELQQPLLDYVEKKGLELTLPPGMSERWAWPTTKVQLKKRQAVVRDDNRLIIYTDGSCLGNPGHGGWGFFSKHGKGSGSGTNVTNNAMEMMAVLQALRYFRKHKPGAPLRILTDSSYTLNGCTKWLPAWTRKNYQGVKNGETWKLLARELALADVEFRWVKAHSGIPGNEAADKLAGAASLAEKLRQQG